MIEPEINNLLENLNLVKKYINDLRNSINSNQDDILILKYNLDKIINSKNEIHSLMILSGKADNIQLHIESLENKSRSLKNEYKEYKEKRNVIQQQLKIYREAEERQRAQIAFNEFVLNLKPESPYRRFPYEIEKEDEFL